MLKNRFPRPEATDRLAALGLVRGQSWMVGLETAPPVKALVVPVALEKVGDGRLPGGAWWRLPGLASKPCGPMEVGLHGSLDRPWLLASALEPT